MGAFKVETCYGDVMVRNVYDLDTGASYYEVYEPTTDDECGYGKYIGEFNSQYDYDDDYERDLFIEDLEVMLDDEDYIGMPTKSTPQQQQHNKRTFYVSYLTYDLKSEGSIVHTHIQLEEGQKANENTFKEIIYEKVNGNPHPFKIFHCSNVIAWSLIEY